MATEHFTGVNQVNKFGAITEMVLAQTSQAGTTDVTSNPVIECYLKEWWPTFQCEVINLVGAIQAKKGSELLGQWIAVNKEKIATMAYLENSVDPGPLAQVEYNQVRRWVECALAGYQEPSDMEIERFVEEWMPQVIKKVHFHNRELERVLAGLAEELELPMRH